MNRATSLYQIPLHIFGYSAELYRGRHEFSQLAGSIGFSSETQQHLMDYPASYTAGITLLCRQMYDIAHAGQPSYSEQRQRAGEIGALMGVLTDIVDDEIDRNDLPLEARIGYLEESAAVLLGGPSTGIQPSNERQRVALELGKYLNQTVIQDDEQGLFCSLFEKLIPDIRLQLTSENLSEQLQLASDVGASCGMLGSVAVEMVDGEEYPEVRLAASSIGSYAECLDHAYEISDDLEEGSITYPTLYIHAAGDTPRNRRRVKGELIALGNGAFNKGLTSLNKHQLPIYHSLRTMLSLRYRVVKRATGIRTDINYNARLASATG